MDNRISLDKFGDVALPISHFKDRCPFYRPSFYWPGFYLGDDVLEFSGSISDVDIYNSANFVKLPCL